jgi:hypothetical protein
MRLPVVGDAPQSLAVARTMSFAAAAGACRIRIEQGSDGAASAIRFSHSRASIIDSSKFPSCPSSPVLGHIGPEESS